MKPALEARKGGVSERELDVMRHALGVQLINGKWTTPFRNHYVAGGDDVATWEALVASGHAVLSRRPSELTGGMPCLSVTDHGKTAALEGIANPRRSTRRKRQ